MARPRKVIDMSTRKISKEEKAIRREAEEKNRLGRDQLTPPEWLGEMARDEFVRVVEEAGQIDMLDNLDLSTLAIYCDAYDKYVDATERIAGRYTILKETAHGSASPVVNPMVNVQEKYARLIMSCSSKLGLATTDRLKLIVPTRTESETNKYLKYLD